MAFLDFCKRYATNHKIEISVPDDPNVIEIPYNLESDIENLVKDLKPKANRFDKLHVTYVEQSFSNFDNVIGILKDVYNEDIDDGIAYALSRYLYDTQFNDLDVDRQSIIKVLTIYILIQNYI